MAESNTIPASPFQEYHRFLPDANKIQDMLDDKSPTAPLIYDLETIGLVTLFKSLAGMFFNIKPIYDIT